MRFTPVNLRDVLRLYLVTDQMSLRGRSLTDVVLAAVQGGVSCVQLREKELGTRDFVALACVMKDLLAPFGVPLVINDRIDVALACGAQGLHLGQSDMPVAVARRLLPPEVFIGLSVETPDHVAQAQGQGQRWTTWASARCMPRQQKLIRLHLGVCPV